ncbi:MAG: hypothetical protein GY832_15550 [Chloroflexi bacterium]|nr:hypothetical protein [Chloroflexota bacterium]
MDNPIIISLVVSGIGMLMLFLALTLLYALMYLMTWITNIALRPKSQPDAEEQRMDSLKRRAAAIAVALARTELESGPIISPQTKIVSSAWQQYHRHRLLNLHRRRAR